MRRVLSTTLAVALLLGLGALAVLALPNPSASLAETSVVSAAAPEFNPDAPATGPNFNMVAMPLNATNQFTSAGLTYDADGLAKLVGSGVRQALSWDNVNQVYKIWTIDEFGGSGTNFPLAVGGGYWLLLDSTSPTIVSFVGDVPAQGSLHFSFVTAASCKFNEFSIPLDQPGITKANQLATALSATQVLHWDATLQLFDIWTVDEFGGSGTDFNVKIGYPYVACLATGAPTTWP
ncbi:MAG: hypothetical protein ACM30E_03655 [Nitrososphaerales archaeon]